MDQQPLIWEENNYDLTTALKTKKKNNQRIINDLNVEKTIVQWMSNKRIFRTQIRKKVNNIEL